MQVRDGFVTWPTLVVSEMLTLKRPYNSMKISQSKGIALEENPVKGKGRANSENPIVTNERRKILTMPTNKKQQNIEKEIGKVKVM